MIFILSIIILTIGEVALISYLTFSLGWYFIFLWIFLGIILFFLQMLIAAMLYTVFHKKTSPFSKSKQYLFYSFALFCKNFIFNVKYTYINKEKLPKDPKQKLVILSNHKSDLDPMLYPILFKSKRAISFTPKSDLYKNYFLRNWLKGLRAIKVDRNNDRNTIAELLKGIKYAQNNLTYVIFPEGGIKDQTTNLMVDDYKSGAYKLPQKSQSDLLPIAVLNASQILKRAPFKRTHVVVIFGDVIKYDDYKDMNTNDLGIMIRDLINNMVINYEKENK